MATIKDVAKQAGVSTTTVSHVINKTRFVAKETEQAVWQAIKQLRYSPSALARSLKINHTKTIGLLASSTEAPYFAELIEALELLCYQQGYTLILCNTHNDLQKQQTYLSMLAQKRVDGLVIMCAEYPPALLAHLENYQSIPMVVLDWQQTRQSFTDTIIDNAFRGGYLAGQYLIERGHRDIAIITGSLQRHTGSSRLDGFRCALADHHLPLKPQWLLEGDFEPKSGYQAMEQLLAAKQRPTAVFCGGDMMAMGAISAAHQYGLQVPKDISVMGYDDIKYACYFSPALTTIHQPKEKICEMALSLLFERITDKRESVKHIELIPYLVERRSVIDGPFCDYRR